MNRIAYNNKLLLAASVIMLQFLMLQDANAQINCKFVWLENPKEYLCEEALVCCGVHKGDGACACGASTLLTGEVFLVPIQPDLCPAAPAA